MTACNSEMKDPIWRASNANRPPFPLNSMPSHVDSSAVSKLKTARCVALVEMSENTIPSEFMLNLVLLGVSLIWIELPTSKTRSVSFVSPPAALCLDASASASASAFAFAVASAACRPHPIGGAMRNDSIEFRGDDATTPVGAAFARVTERVRIDIQSECKFAVGVVV